MDEKVEHKHKCLRDIDACNVLGYHECECGARAALRTPQRWVTESSAMLGLFTYMLLTEALSAIENPAAEALEVAIKNCHNNRNEPPHYHAYAYGDGGQFHICLKAQASDEESAANEAARICESVGFQTAELIHVGGGVDAYHSSKVESASTFNFGRIDGSRLN